MSLPGACWGACGVACVRCLVAMGAPEGTGHSGGVTVVVDAISQKQGEPQAGG